MKSTLIHHIGMLAGIRPKGQHEVKGADMSIFPFLQDAYVMIESGIISAYGPQSEAPERADEVIDATDRIVMPAWCDAHTHIVYAAPRHTEFTGRISGLTYEQIAERGGGILNSAKLLSNTSEEELYDDALLRLEEVQQYGTAAIEIKSGYGLSTESELKMLRVIRKLKENSKMAIRSTFLGAHAFPDEYKQNHEGYIRLIIDTMLPKIADEGLADFIDVFCEKGYFSVDEMKKLIEAGLQYGLKAKVHVNQFNVLGGVKAAAQLGAVSVDHLEHLSEEDVSALQSSYTIPVALPACSLFINILYTPARRLIDAGLPLALATDFNPGSCPSGNMNLVNSLGCIALRMTPEEVMNASTLNGARAMELHRHYGSITVGKRAALIITKPASDIALLPYHFGSNLVEKLVV